MAKSKQADTLALEKSQQKKVAKETKKLKKDIKDGSIVVRKNHKQKELKKEQKRGLIYIGHIPHGFYEEEMKNYFKQFGKVTNVKVCRSRTTGNSKGFGYVEFEHPEVAKIAADTMNNYVMFKKRIVTEFVPQEKRPKGLFHGKSSTPLHTSVRTRQGKEKHSRNQILDDKVVVKKQKAALGKLNKKLKKLKELGIQCNIKPVDANESVIKLLEPGKSDDSSSSVVVKDSNSKTEFKKPSIKLVKSKNSGKSKEPSPKSLTSIKSKRVMLAKSLDSVKSLLSSKSLKTGQDVETQTSSGKIKTEKKGKIGKAKKEKKPLNFNQDTVKKLARELIRKRGNPLINLVSSTTKSKKASKRK